MFEPALQIDGRNYAFRMGVESVDLGPAGEVDYIAFDGADVREAGGGSNGKAIVDAWWALCQYRTDAVDFYDHEHLLKASAYLRLCTSHALQDVYRCAFLSARANRHVQLDPREDQHVSGIARTGDITLVRQAMESCLLMDLPPEGELIAYQHAAAKLTGLGHCLLAMDEPEAIDRYLQRLIPFIDKLRRQNDEKLGAAGRGDRVRRMLNFFAYDCLACFHHCAAAVLSELTRGLLPQSSMSARFNAFMHDCWRVDTAEGVLRGDHRGLLGGQILSLHPIGRWLLGHADHRHAIGGWIASEDYGRLSLEQTLAHPAYRDALLAVLRATHEYRHAYEQSEGTRHPHQSIVGDALRQSEGGQVEPARDDAPALELELFDQLAHRHHLCCKGCGGKVEYLRWEPPQKKHAGAVVYYQCRSCEIETDRRFTFEQFKSALADAA